MRQRLFQPGDFIFRGDYCLLLFVHLAAVFAEFVFSAAVDGLVGIAVVLVLIQCEFPLRQVQINPQAGQPLLGVFEALLRLPQLIGRAGPSSRCAFGIFVSGAFIF